MEQPLQTFQEDCQAKGHPFEVPVLPDKAEEIETANSKETRDKIQRTVPHKNDVPLNSFSDKKVGQLQTNKTNIFIVVLIVVSMGSIIGLVVNIFRTEKQIGNHSNRIIALEKVAAVGAQNDAVLKGPDTKEDLTKNSSTNMEEIATTLSAGTIVNSVSNEDSTLSQMMKTKLTIATTLSLPTSAFWTVLSSSTISTSKPTSSNIPSTTAATTTTPKPPTTTIDEPTGFQVLKKQWTMYMNFTFLALQVEVPIDGLSVTENWCRDYENLCKRFGVRPTGCGGSKYINSIIHKACRELYNSDMDNENVLGCTPATHLPELANDAFPGESTLAVGGQNSFGFMYCTAAYCKNTIKDNSFSLSSMQGALDANKTIMYTVCR